MAKAGAKGKYTEEIVNAIIDLVENTDSTIKFICESVGIHPDTYYDWLQNKPEFSDAIKKADSRRLKTFMKIARESAFKKIKGYEYIEEHTTLIDDGLGKPKIKEKKTVKKHVAASDTLVMYMLNNTDPDDFAYKEKHEHSGSTEHINIYIPDNGRQTD